MTPQIFITKLIENGVYKNAIAKNDFDNCYKPQIWLTIPYGQKNSCNTFVIKVFGEKTLQKAINFWDTNIDKTKVLTY